MGIGRGFGVCLHESTSHVWSAQPFQIHGQKGDFRDHVDIAESFIEFDAIDDLALPRFQINMFCP
jgi:hypothetical protein